MYNGLLHAHSGLRWIVLALLVAAIIKAFSGWKGNSQFTEGDRKLALFTLIFTHIQLLLGLWLYFISPKVAFVEGFMKDSVLRFYSVEHITLMLIAIILITVGFSAAKRASEDAARFKKIAVYYLIGLLVILAGIPWPFRELGAGWF